MIVQRLRAIQEAHGYLPERELEQLAQVTNTPLYRIQEVASFFAHFRMEWEKPPYAVVQVCRDYTCHLRGAAKLLSAEGLGRFASKDENKTIVVEGVSCLGRCDRAPVVCLTRYHSYGQHDGHDHDHDPKNVHEAVYAARPWEQLKDIVTKLAAGSPIPQPDTDATYTPHGNPIPNEAKPTSRYLIDVYAHREDVQPYQAVRNLLEKHPKPVTPPNRPDDLNKWLAENYPFLWELQLAGLLGMGGAGVPAFRKWLDVWQAAGDEKYIVCNGDESEPGTFKDREILLRMPHLTVEGVILAGLLTNATAGYIYIRHEYPEQIEACRKAIEQARSMGVCGDNLLKTGRNFDVDVFVSPGGYICGEQSALLEAMSDRRAQPRNRPPELATNGLRDKPTVVNNVETLSWTPGVMLQGGDWYAKASTGGLKGRRLISISGDLVRPGVYEVPISCTLGELVQMCGGVPGGKRLLAAATSGPSGGILPVRLPLPTDADLEARFRDVLVDKLADQAGKLRKEKKTDDEIAAAERAMLDKYRADNWEPFLTDDKQAFDLLKLPLDLNQYKAYSRLLGIGNGKTAGMMLGAGVLVYAEGTDILSQAVNFSQFFRNESCGKCVPCRIGSQKTTQLGEQLIELRANKTITEGDVLSVQSTVGTMSEAMVATSICSLGQVAPNPLMTALDYFKGQVTPSPRPRPTAPAAGS